MACQLDQYQDKADEDHGGCDKETHQVEGIVQRQINTLFFLVMDLEYYVENTVGAGVSSRRVVPF